MKKCEMQPYPLHMSEKCCILSDMKAMQRIREHLQALAPGEPFTPKSLLEWGPRSAVDQALSRLTAQGLVRRVGRGLYARPLWSEWSGEAVPVVLERALEVKTRALGEVIAPHGAVAVNRFGLSSQLPLRAVFLTTGRSRSLNIEGREVKLMHTSVRSLPLGGSRPGLALTAMRYLGIGQLEPAHVRRIREQLSPEEWATVKSALSGQPAWLIETIQRSEGHYAPELF